MKRLNIFKLFAKTILLYSLSLGLAHIAMAQTDLAEPAQQRNTPKRGVYIEGRGNALAFSVNYDSRFQKRNDGWGYRIGIGGFTDLSNYNTSMLSVPVQINYLAGKGSNFFEAGIGVTYTSMGFWEDIDIKKHTPVLGTITLGYRYQPPESGFLFRVGLTPFFGSKKYIEGYYDPMGEYHTKEVTKVLFLPFYRGLSLGYTF